MHYEWKELMCSDKYLTKLNPIWMRPWANARMRQEKTKFQLASNLMFYIINNKYINYIVNNIQSYNLL